MTGPWRYLVFRQRRSIYSWGNLCREDRCFISPGDVCDAGVHTHTNDLRIVVIKGAYLYRADGRETRVGPGGFLFVPGGTKHWSGGDPKDGAQFYQEGLGKFDLIPVK